MNDKINAECSLCWKCKFGVCIKETEQEYVYHNGFYTQKDEVEDQYGIFGHEEDIKEPEVTNATVEHERIKTICFWRPKGIEDSPPILVSKVEQCNRFEE